MQVLRVVLVLITIGCIVGPVGAVVIMYRNNLPQMVVTPQIEQLLNFGNNDSNNNENNNQNNNNNNINQNDNNNNGNSNSGNVNNNNPPVNNPTSSFGGTGQFDMTIPSNGNQVSDEISSNVNCALEQNGNNIQLSLTLEPQSVPSDLQPTFTPNNNYAFNFAGTNSTSDSGTQITANAQGSMPGGTFNINFNGTIDQLQDTLTFTLTSATNSPVSITTTQAIDTHPNNNNNNSSNNNGNNSSNNNNNANNNSGPTYTTGTINTSKKMITLTFTATNSNSQSETLNSMGGTIETTTGQYQLGTVSLDNAPVTIPTGQTITFTLSGSLTSSGQSALSDHFSGESTIDITAVNAKMTLNGVSQPQSGAQDIGNINITN